MKNVGVPCCAVVDLDGLQDPKELAVLGDSLGLVDAKKEELEEARLAIETAVGVREDKEVIDKLRSSVTRFLDELSKGEHSLAGARGALNRLRKSANKWATIKFCGIGALTEPALSRVKEILSHARASGLFLVPVGELEGWVNFGAITKAEWVPKALEAIHQGQAPKELRAFVASIIEYFGEGK